MMPVPMIIIAPILIPFFTALACLAAWGRRRVQRRICILGAGVLCLAGGQLFITVWRQGVVTLRLGNWPAPYGIILAADTLGASLAAVAAVIGLAAIVSATYGMDRRRETEGFYAIAQVMLMGACGAFLTGDIFNLYVWFEVLLIASFVLLSLGGGKAQLEGTVKYVALNMVASAIFLAAVGLFYGVVGTLNLADAAVKVAEVNAPALMGAIGLMFLLAFGIKAAIFPLYFWLPAAYPTPSFPVSALFGGLLTKVGLYAMIRTHGLLFIPHADFWGPLLLTLAGLTMIAGMMGALSQRGFGRIISFNLVGHMGYMLMGLGLFSPMGLAGAIYYMAADMIDIATLFLIGGAVALATGNAGGDTRRMGGLWERRPFLAALFIAPAMSLSGLPPMAGFWGKLGLLRAALADRHYWIATAALAAAFLTLLSMARLWEAVFWKPPPSERHGGPERGPERRPEQRPEQRPDQNIPFVRGYAPILVLAGLSLLLGLLAEPAFQVARSAAENIIDPAAYIRAALGEAP